MQYDVNGGQGSISQSVHVPGNSYPLSNGTGFVREGYLLSGWERKTEQGVEFYPLGATVSDLASSGETVVLYAKWTAEQYKVTFNPNGGTVSTTTKTIEFNAPYGSLPTTTRTGYTFMGWTLNDQPINADSIVNTTGDRTLVASWKMNTYTVLFDSQGGSSCASKSVTYDAKYGTLPTPTKKGYTFNGWTLSSGSSVTSQTTVKTAIDHTLTAKWTANTYSITYNLNSVDSDGETMKSSPTLGSTGKGVTYMSKDPLDIPTNGKYYTFAGWYTEDGKQLTDASGKPISGNVTGCLSGGKWIITGELQVVSHWNKTYPEYKYISTAEEFKKISDNLSGKYMLVNDIDFEGAQIEPITSFSGTIKGNDYYVKNFKIFVNTGDRAGLFKTVTEDGLVERMKISNATIEPRWDSGEVDKSKLSNDAYVGIIVGENLGTIDGCKVYNSKIDAWNFNNTVTKNKLSVGGIAGRSDGKIASCETNGLNIKAICSIGYTNGTVETNAGGICGMHFGTIRNCTSSNNELDIEVRGGNYLGTYDAVPRAGGIAGYNRGTVTSPTVSNNTLDANWHTYASSARAVNKRAKGDIVGLNDGIVN